MNDIHAASDGTVTSDNRAIALDLDGLAEGYAAEQIATILHTHRIDNAIINIGGDVLARGGRTVVADHAACALLLTEDDHLYITPAMQKRVVLLHKPASITAATHISGDCD